MIVIKNIPCPKVFNNMLLSSRVKSNPHKRLITTRIKRVMILTISLFHFNKQSLEELNKQINTLMKQLMSRTSTLQILMKEKTITLIIRNRFTIFMIIKVTTNVRVANNNNFNLRIRTQQIDFKKSQQKRLKYTD